MKLKRFLTRTGRTALAIVTMFILFFKPVAAEDARHPSNLWEIAHRDMYAVEKLVLWLNNTGVAARLNVDLSNISDIISRSPTILEQVYGNATLALFIGGLQLRQLKIFARVSTKIDGLDVLNLLKTVVLGVNITKVDTGCTDAISKVFANLAHPRRCVFTPSDLEEVSFYTAVLGRDLPKDMVASVLGKVYIMKRVLAGAQIHREVFNRLLDDLLYEESLPLYVILSIAADSANISIVDGLSTSSAGEQLLVLPNGSGAAGAVEPISLEHIEKAMELLTQVLALAEKHGIELRAEDIPRIIDYALSTDLVSLAKLVDTLDDVEVLRPSELNGVLEGLEGLDEEELDEDMAGWPSTSGVAVHMSGENGTGHGGGGSLLEGSGTGGGSGMPAGVLDIEVYIKQLEPAILGNLAKSLNKVNTVVLHIAPPAALDSARDSLGGPSPGAMAVRKDGAFPGLWVYAIGLVFAFFGTVAILKPGLLARVFTVLLSRKSADSTLGGTNMAMRGAFWLFWDLVYALASRLGVEVGRGDTHREVCAKIIAVARDEELRRTLGSIARGYEVLRFSNNPDVDEDVWLEMARNTLRMYGA